MSTYPDVQATAQYLIDHHEGFDGIFLEGIQYALGLDGWRWERFVDNIREAIYVVQFPNWERTPFYTEKCHAKCIPKRHVDYKIAPNWKKDNGTWYQTNLYETQYDFITGENHGHNHLESFESPASGWWDVELRFMRVDNYTAIKESQQEQRFTDTVPFNTAFDEDFDAIGTHDWPQSHISWLKYNTPS